MLPPIKIKICDRDQNMATAYGGKRARVETQEGQIVIKDEDAILKTDRVISFIPNDFISPIKIKIINLNIIYAFLESELARIAFFAQIEYRTHQLLEFCKFKSSVAFHDILKTVLTKTSGKIHEKNTLKGFCRALSIFVDSKQTAFFRFEQNVKGIRMLNEKLLPNQSMIMRVVNISETIILSSHYKTIGDITQGTIQEQFLGDNTINNIFVEKKITNDKE
mgnify:CR=1 FL=1|uniref:Uncharacterized protein n=1 Tax=Siphoviridae sp. ctyvQ1 TaxID=2826525 RepID=A0A8S5QZ62_9CAUD|nr:MAG TPA: hypothetical protein [Siphoviridae sp. ctyvQ1]